jgi:WD40 repeat protein
MLTIYQIIPSFRLRRCLAVALLLLCPGALFSQDLLTSPLPERSMEGSDLLLRIALASDGTAALLQQRGNTFRAVGLPAGKLLRQFGPLQGKITALALAGATGPAFVATEKDVWSVPIDPAGAPRKLWSTEAIIHGLSLSPDLDLLAVGTSKGAKVLHPGTGAIVWPSSWWSGSGQPCTSVCFAPVGGTLALGTGKTVQIHAVPGFKLKQSWSFEFPVLALAFAPDARALAVAGGQGSLLVKRASDGETLNHLSFDSSGRDRALITFASDSTGLFVGSGRKLLAFSELDLGTPVSQVIAVDTDLLSLAFSKSAGALLAATEGSMALTRWSVVNPLKSGPRPGRDVPWIRILSPVAGAKIATGTVDVTFKVTFPADHPVSAIRFLADGRPVRITASPAPGNPAVAFEGTFARTFQSGQIYTCQVALPDKATTLLAVAEGERGASEPAVVALLRAATVRPKGNAKVVPPEITLVSPGGEALLRSAALDVVVKVDSVPDQPVEVVRVMLDGVPIPLREVVRADGSPFDPSVGWVNGESYRLPIKVPERDSTLMVIAETAFAGSNPAMAKLRWKTQSAASTPGVTTPPQSGEESSPKLAEEPSNGQVKATAENATRILEGSPQSDPLPMEVDAKGRLRWRDKATEPAKKPAFRGAPTASAPVASKASIPGQPTVQILTPANGSRFKEKEVQLSVKVGFPPGQEVTTLQVFVDGTPVESVPQSAAGAPLNPPYPNGKAFKLRITLPPQDCQITLLAKNASHESKPSLLRLKYDGKVAPGTASRSVSQMAKPRITIFSPQPNALVRGKTVQVGVRVGLDPRQPPPAIRILVDAQEVKAERAVAQRAAAVPAAPQPTSGQGGTEEVQYYNVPIPSKDCTIVAYAETSYATSDPTLVKLRWDAPTSASSGTGLPTLYLLAVGVSKYKDKNYSLQYPGKDAKDFAEAMKLQKGTLYKDVVARVRTDETATRDNVMDDLEWIQRQATQHDMVIVFFAGHGINDIVTGNYYFLPHDANMEAVKRTMIPGSEIHSTLAKLTGTRLLFMDTCHAGNVTGTGTRGLPDMQQFLLDLKEGGQGLVVITSSRPGQKSQEHPSWNNGAFTKALVEGLNGKATKDKQGFVTFTALDAYITQRVKELTKGTQSPTTQKSTEVSDFPLAFSAN